MSAADWPEELPSDGFVAGPSFSKQRHVHQGMMLRFRTIKVPFHANASNTSASNAGASAMIPPVVAGYPVPGEVKPKVNPLADHNQHKSKR
jgi:hypothetical protein